MRRALYVGMVAAVSMGMMGCATGEEDPVVPDPAPEAQRDPPRKSLSAPLRNREQLLLSGIAINNGFQDVGPEQNPRNPPIPSPFKEPSQRR